MKTKIFLILSLSMVLLLTSCSEETLPPDEEILINKWHYDLMNDDYHCFALLVRAAMHDPSTFELDSLVDKTRVNLVLEISRVLEQNVKPVQSFLLFKDMPGNTPWGETDKPIYRKSLPSEMGAMKKLVKTYAGDCSSLSQLSTALCRINGISEDEIFIVRTKEHSAGIIQYKSELYLFSNSWVEKLSGIELFMLNRYKVTGFYNDRYYSKKHVFITKKGLSRAGTLKEKLESRYGVKFNDIQSDYPQQSIEYLTRIALQEQSTDIVDIINASVRGPLFKQKCTENATIDDMVEWINLNVESKPLFSYDSFMTPDQVIVFKTAGFHDKAIFLWCFCRNKNIPCELFKNNEAYCLKTGERLFLIEEKISESDTIPGNALPSGFMPVNML